MALLDATRTVIASAKQLYDGTEHTDGLTAMETRLDAPLRVAVAGKVKGGQVNSVECARRRSARTHR